MDSFRKGIKLRHANSLDDEPLFHFDETDANSEMECETVESDHSIPDLRILVVEDAALNQLLMKTLLHDFGFDCTIAANGKIAIDKLEQGSYDLILMDLQMPVMNGFEVTEYIRKEMKLNVPIVALTADITSVNLTRCQAIGMNDYIPKPVDDLVLHTKIVELVKKHAPDSKKKTDKIHTFIDSKHCNLESLTYRTKSQPKLMTEMILLYLEQVPILVKVMNESLIAKNWKSLNAAAHKIIPSFAIMGIHKDHENLARKIEEYTGANKQFTELPELVSQLENICLQACEELKEVLKKNVYGK